jgi:hypothetical protein
VSPQLPPVAVTLARFGLLEVHVNFWLLIVLPFWSATVAANGWTWAKFNESEVLGAILIVVGVLLVLLL